MLQSAYNSIYSGLLIFEGCEKSKMSNQFLWRDNRVYMTIYMKYRTIIHCLNSLATGTH